MPPCCAPADSLTLPRSTGRHDPQPVTRPTPQSPEAVPAGSCSVSHGSQMPDLHPRRQGMVRTHAGHTVPERPSAHETACGAQTGWARRNIHHRAVIWTPKRCSGSPSRSAASRSPSNRTPKPGSPLRPPTRCQPKPPPKL